MAYPERSNFRTGGQDAYWFFVLPDGSRRVCQVSGEQFIKTVQYLLRQGVPANSPTYAGTVSGSSVVIDAKIGLTTLKALYAMLTRMNAPEDLKSEVEANAHGNTSVNPEMSLGTMRAMVWVFARAGQNPQSGDVVLPIDTVRPLFGIAPASGTTQVTCALINAPASAGPNPGLPQPEPTPGEPPPAPGEWTPPKTGETWGKDIAPDGTKPVEKIVEELNEVGRLGTKDPITLALEQPVAPIPSTPPGSGLSTGTKIAIGVAAVAVVALIAVAATRGSSGPTRRRRKNPRGRKRRV